MGKLAPMYCDVIRSMTDLTHAQENDTLDTRTGEQNDPTGPTRTTGSEHDEGDFIT